MSRRFLIFAVISGTGWLLDITLSFTLVQFGLIPFLASFTGAGTSVTLVYVISRLALFDEKRIGSPGEYGFYVLWQICAIALGSALVALCAATVAPFVATSTLTGPDPLAAGTAIGKVVMTPISLTANYFFMRWLTDRSNGRNREKETM